MEVCGSKKELFLNDYMQMLKYLYLPLKTGVAENRVEQVYLNLAAMAKYYY